MATVNPEPNGVYLKCLELGPPNLVVECEEAMLKLTIASVLSPCKLTLIISGDFSEWISP